MMQFNIPERLDRRVKLTKSQKAEIYSMYNEYCAYSPRELARMFGVSRRTIVFIVDPHQKAEMLKRRKERGGSKQYYDKSKNTVAVRNHRRYKRKLKLNGELENG